MDIETVVRCEGSGGPPTFAEAAFGFFAIEARSVPGGIFGNREEHTSHIFANCFRRVLRSYGLGHLEHCVMVEQPWHEIPRTSVHEAPFLFSNGCTSPGAVLEGMEKHLCCDIYAQFPLRVHTNVLGEKVLTPPLPVVEREHIFVECKLLREGRSQPGMMRDILRVSLLPAAAGCHRDRVGSHCLFAIENVGKPGLRCGDVLLSKALSPLPCRQVRLECDDLVSVAAALSGLGFQCELLICHSGLGSTAGAYLVTIVDAALVCDGRKLEGQELLAAITPFVLPSSEPCDG